MKIVFVDDETGILYSIKRLLRKKDWEVITFSVPQEAISFLDGRDDIDLVVSDYRMPLINGVDLLKKVKALCPNTLRIILSGHADLHGLLGAINQAEIYRFITKPWVDEEFILTLETSIQYNKVIQENIRLSNIIRSQNKKMERQQSELQRLEKESPGITKIKWGEDGEIDISDEFEI